MTKAELQADLASRFYKVCFPKGADPEDVGYQLRVKEKILWYHIGVYENTGAVLLRRNIPVYCEVTGAILKEQRGTLEWDDLPGGNFFYGERMPENQMIPVKVDPATTFAAKVESQINSQITKGTILKGAIVEVSEEKKFAKVRAFSLEAGVVSEKDLFVYEDAAGAMKASLVNLIK